MKQTTDIGHRRAPPFVRSPSVILSSSDRDVTSFSCKRYLSWITQSSYNPRQCGIWWDISCEYSLLPAILPFGKRFFRITESIHHCIDAIIMRHIVVILVPLRSNPQPHRWSVTRITSQSLRLLTVGTWLDLVLQSQPGSIRRPMLPKDPSWVDIHRPSRVLYHHPGSQHANLSRCSITQYTNAESSSCWSIQGLGGSRKSVTSSIAKRVPAGTI